MKLCDAIGSQTFGCAFALVLAGRRGPNCHPNATNAGDRASIRLESVLTREPGF